MSMTILTEGKYLRTEIRQTEDLSTRPAAHRLSILSDMGCSSRPVSSLRIHLRTCRQPKVGDSRSSLLGEMAGLRTASPSWAVPPCLQLPTSSLTGPSRAWDRAPRPQRGNYSRHFGPHAAHSSLHGGGQRHKLLRTARVGETSELRHAVCVTGLEREYPEISRNIERAIFGLLNRTAAQTVTRVFGVRPPNDNWTHAMDALRFEAVGLQSWSYCYPADMLLPFWFTCSRNGGTSRMGVCTRSFMQVMCDLEQCEQLIATHEAQVGQPFDFVTRIRLDVAWEAELPVPTAVFQVHVRIRVRARTAPRHPTLTPTLTLAVTLTLPALRRGYRRGARAAHERPGRHQRQVRLRRAPRNGGLPQPDRLLLEERLLVRLGAAPC
jgi:hypothetical protein